MGFLKDINTLKKQAKEIDKTFDPGAQMRAGKERMAAAKQMMAQQTIAAQLARPASGPTPRSSASHDTGTQINIQPMIELDLLVTRAGQPPYPAKVTQLVAQRPARPGRAGLDDPGVGRSWRTRPRCSSVSEVAWPAQDRARRGGRRGTEQACLRRRAGIKSSVRPGSADSRGTSPTGGP